jgi:hypothetical protein
MTTKKTGTEKCNKTTDNLLQKIKLGDVVRLLWDFCLVLDDRVTDLEIQMSKKKKPKNG